MGTNSVSASEVDSEKNSLIDWEHLMVAETIVNGATDESDKKNFQIFD